MNKDKSNSPQDYSLITNQYNLEKVLLGLNQNILEQSEVLKEKLGDFGTFFLSYKQEILKEDAMIKDIVQISNFKGCLEGMEELKNQKKILQYSESLRLLSKDFKKSFRIC